jgi:hypothetical protein
VKLSECEKGGNMPLIFDRHQGKGERRGLFFIALFCVNIIRFTYHVISFEKAFSVRPNFTGFPEEGGDEGDFPLRGEL